MRKFNVAIIFMLALAGKSLFAQGGALPKGVDKAPVKTKKLEPKVKKPSKPSLEGCTGRIFAAGEGVGSFTKDGKLFYLLARNKNSGKLQKYTVFKIDPELKRAEPIYSLEQKGEVALMPLNDPIKAVTTVSFIGPCASFYEGAAGSVTVSLEKEKKTGTAVRQSGDYVLADTPSGRVLADTKKNAVLEMDGMTFQTKFSARFEKGDRPIYFDSSKRFLVAWHQDTKRQGLATYYNESTKPGARLAIAEGDRLLRNADRFGAYTALEKSNSIVIHEVPDWSGVTEKRDFTVKVDPDMPVGKAAVVVNFSARVVALFSQSWTGRSAKNKVYLYSYDTGKFIGKISPAVGDVPGYVSFTRNGQVLLVETKNYTGKNSTNIKMMHVDTGLIDTIKLIFKSE